MASGNKISLSWERTPEKIRFILVGGVGVLIGWAVYNIVYHLNPITEFKAPSSWLIAALLNVFRQHGFHFILTFKDHDSEYIPSLIGAYWSYSLGITLGLILDFTLTEIFNLNHQLAWIIVMICSLPISFVMLKRFSFKGKKNKL